MVIDQTESELIQAAKRGDSAAFASLLRAEYRVAFRLAYGLLHDSDEAEDAVQEGAFRAWRRIRNLRDGTRLRPWLLAIVANECRAIRAKPRAATNQDDVVDRVESRETDIAQSVDLRRGLARLDHDQRLALVLRFYLDLPYEEIAITLGLTTKAARNRVERAVQRLRPIVQMQEAYS